MLPAVNKSSLNDEEWCELSDRSNVPVVKEIDNGWQTKDCQLQGDNWQIEIAAVPMLPAVNKSSLNDEE